MAQRVMIPVAFLLILQLGFACGGESDQTDEPTATQTVAATATAEPSPTMPPEAKPVGPFTDELEQALVEGDVGWFSDNLYADANCWYYEDLLPECQTASLESRFPAIQVQRWRGDGGVLGRAEFERTIAELFGRVDSGAEDAYGPGTFTLHGTGERFRFQQMHLVQVHFMTTAILGGPEPGRWVFVWIAERPSGEPERWQLRRLLQVPPSGADRALSFMSLADTAPDLAAYPPGFGEALEAVERAAANGDSRGLAEYVAFRSHACADLAGTLASVPSCHNQADEESVNAVHWGVYCGGCDHHGYATEAELVSWLDALFEGAVGPQADGFGPAGLDVAVVNGASRGSGFDVTLTGITNVGPIAGDVPPPGRWLLTLTFRELDDGWKADELTTASPGNTEWMLPVLLGTDITWMTTTSTD